MAEERPQGAEGHYVVGCTDRALESTTGDSTAWQGKDFQYDKLMASGDFLMVTLSTEVI